MDHTKVESTNLESVSYDTDSNSLEIKFKKTGATYTYKNVNEQEYNELMQAKSKGKYFNRVLKHKHFTRGG